MSESETQNHHYYHYFFSQHYSKCHKIRLTCCSLCLKFVLSNEIVLNWEIITLGDKNIKQLVQSIFRTDQPLPDDLFNGICQPCLVRLDLMATVTREIAEKAGVSKKMETFMKAEKRTWFSISTATQNNPSIIQIESQQVQRRYIVYKLFGEINFVILFTVTTFNYYTGS